MTPLYPHHCQSQSQSPLSTSVGGASGESAATADAPPALWPANPAVHPRARVFRAEQLLERAARWVASGQEAKGRALIEAMHRAWAAPRKPCTSVLTVETCPPEMASEMASEARWS